MRCESSAVERKEGENYRSSVVMNWINSVRLSVLAARDSVRHRECVELYPRMQDSVKNMDNLLLCIHVAAAIV
jgi:hypothetical protein